MCVAVRHGAQGVLRRERVGVIVYNKKANVKREICGDIAGRGVAKFAVLVYNTRKCENSM